MRSECPAAITKTSKFFKRVPAIGLTICAFLFTGCDDARTWLPLNPVTGHVFADGRPLAGAAVVFYPVGGSDALQDLRPRGVTNSEGQFQLQTYLPGDGAPAGEFKVAITWHGEPLPEDSEDQRHDAGNLRRNLLVKSFAEPASTPLRVTISNRENTLEPFQVELASHK